MDVQINSLNHTVSWLCSLSLLYYTLFAGVLDFATANFSFKVTFDSQSRGLITLPCVEVGGVSSEGVMSVKVVIAQYSPHEALRNCTVKIVEPTEDTEAPGEANN